MKFVKETVINEIAELLNDSSDGLEKRVTDLHEHQSVLFGYIFSENLKVLLQEEREFVLFLLVIIILASEMENGPLQPVDVKVFEDAEEKNWELLGEKVSTPFRERLDVFFQNTEQEDLLAFIEDTLSDSEDGMVTKEGREVVFIFLKSVIDCLKPENN
jgi:hypothetical protein